MKMFKLIYLLAMSILVVSPIFAAETEVFSVGGLTNWDYIGGGTAYDADNGNAEHPFKELMTLNTPASTNDYGVDGGSWDWDVAELAPVGHVLPNSGSYVGVRYEAPAGKLITGVTIPRLYVNVDTNMHVQIFDADDVFLVDPNRTVLTELITDVTATSTGTSAIEIRWVNIAPSTIHLWGVGNGVIFNTIEIVTEDDPDYVPFSPLTFENPNKPSTWFGYYHGLTVYSSGPLGGTNWGDSIAVAGSYTNLNHVFPSQEAIDSAIANHSYMLVDVMWYLFSESSPGSFSLRGDYQNQIQGLKTMFAGAEDYIGAFSPLDEPYHRNVPQADLEAVIAELKAVFPGIPSYLCFARDPINSMTTATLPAGLDWIAFDYYDTAGGPVQISEVQGTVNHIKSIKSADQKIFLVPPSAQDNLQAAYTDQQLADTINAYYGLMQSDPEIIGMIVFPADGCRQVVFDGIGTTIPLALAAQQAIGAEIAGEVCGDIWNGLYTFDYDGNCKIDLLDWAVYTTKWLAE